MFKFVNYINLGGSGGCEEGNVRVQRAMERLRRRVRILQTEQVKSTRMYYPIQKYDEVQVQRLACSSITGTETHSNTQKQKLYINCT